MVIARAGVVLAVVVVVLAAVVDELVDVKFLAESIRTLGTFLITTFGNFW